MTRKKPDRVQARDEQGRPTDVIFDGNPALQCPACLSTNVGPRGAVGFVPAGNELLLGSDAFAPIRKMHCADCGGSWMRPGV
jgi:hypothetical protein